MRYLLFTIIFIPIIVFSQSPQQGFKYSQYAGNVSNFKWYDVETRQQLYNYNNVDVYGAGAKFHRGNKIWELYFRCYYGPNNRYTKTWNVYLRWDGAKFNGILNGADDSRGTILYQDHNGIISGNIIHVRGNTKSILSGLKLNPSLTN